MKRIVLKPELGLSDLGYACELNDVVWVRKLLNSGAKVNVPDYRLSYPIHFAARHGNVEILTSLIEQGSRLDVLNSNGESPLHCAVRSCHVDIIRILIERGCDVNINQPEIYVPPLLVAVTSCTSVDLFETMLKLLLSGNCVLNGLYPASLYTPLYTAICQNKDGHAMALLRHGASPNVDCPQGLTILQKACYKSLNSLAVFLLSCDIDWSREHWLDVDIYHSGINPRLFTVYYDSVPIALVHNTDLYRTIQQVRTNPASLSHSCRLLIRRCLKPPLFTSVSYLPLPASVQNFLMLV